MTTPRPETDTRGPDTPHARSRKHDFVGVKFDIFDIFLEFLIILRCGIFLKRFEIVQIAQ